MPKRKSQQSTRRRIMVKRDVASPSFVAFGRNCWYLQWEDGGWNSGGSEGLGEELGWEMKHAQSNVKCLSLGTDDDRWWYKLEDGSCKFYGLDNDLFTKMQRWDAEYVQFFDNGGYFVKFEDGSTLWNNVPADLSRLAAKWKVDRVYSDGNNWLATFDNGGWEYSGLPDGLWSKIPSSLLAGSIRFLGLSPDGGSYFASIKSKIWWCAPDIIFDTLMNPVPTRLPQSAIYFTNNSISRWFQDGGSVDDAISELSYQYIAPDDFPPIRVVFHQKGWWSLDNRRLYCFREAGVRHVPVQAVEIETLRITGDGVHVYVRD
jgi:hypothetical protein